MLNNNFHHKVEVYYLLDLAAWEKWLYKDLVDSFDVGRGFLHSMVVDLY